MAGTSRCRSCGAPIIWATTGSGKAMPLDRDPVPDGNTLVHNGECVYLTPGLTETLTRDKPRYKSHFATCTSPAVHRYRPAKPA